MHAFLSIFTSTGSCRETTPAGGIGARHLFALLTSNWQQRLVRWKDETVLRDAPTRTIEVRMGGHLSSKQVPEMRLFSSSPTLQQRPRILRR